MSISPTVGGLSTYLSQIKLSGTWQSSKTKYDELVGRIPAVGPTVRELSQRLRAVGRELRPAGPAVRGPRDHLHRARARATTSRRSSRPSSRRSSCAGPVIVHVRTQKGRGFRPAEADQVGFHGAALPPMTVPAATTRTAAPTATARAPAAAASAPAAPRPRRAGPRGRRDADRIDGRRRGARLGRRPAAARTRTTPRSSSKELIERARTDERIVAITAGHADRDRPLDVPGGVPGAVHRRRDRRAALRRARDRSRDGRDAAGRRPLLDVPPAGLRPDGPRRLPERPAGPDRGRPGGARRRGRDEPPGDVHAARPSGSCRTS